MIGAWAYLGWWWVGVALLAGWVVLVVLIGWEIHRVPLVDDGYYEEEDR